MVSSYAVSTVDGLLYSLILQQCPLLQSSAPAAMAVAAV